MTSRTRILTLSVFSAFSVSGLQAQYLMTYQGPAAISTDPTVTYYNASTLVSSSKGLPIAVALQVLFAPDGSK